MGLERYAQKTDKGHLLQQFEKFTKTLHQHSQLSPENPDLLDWVQVNKDHVDFFVVASKDIFCTVLGKMKGMIVGRGISVFDGIAAGQ